MEKISQKSINKIIEYLESVVRTEESINLANELKAVEIIPALYVMTYLQAVDKIRRDTQVPDTSSDISKKYKFKKDDYEKFSKAINQQYHLELSHLIDSPEKFEGAMWLLYQALDRKDKFCDYDDTKLAKTMIGKCQYEDHDGKNPNNQNLELMLGYDEDSSKFTDDGSIYVCKTCADSINENADGNVSCDMEMG